MDDYVNVYLMFSCMHISYGGIKKEYIHTKLKRRIGR